MAKQSVNRLAVPHFIPRYRITLVPDGGHTAPCGLLRDSAAAAAALRPCFDGLDREQFVVCCLDAKNVSIGVNVVSIGSLNFSIVHPREVLCAVSYGMVSPFQMGRTWRNVLGSTAYLEGKPKGDKSMLVTQGLSRRC